MRRVLLVLLCTGYGATAQFSDLAVTDDGFQIYFTSQLPLRAETDRGGGVYRSTSGWVERILAPPAVDAYRPHARTMSSVSGGGTVLTWTEESRCTGGSSCLSNPTTWSSTLITPNGQQALTGRAQVSRNGRYVLNYQVLYYWFSTTPLRELRDLQTGVLTTLNVTPTSPRQSVTSDGRVLGTADGSGDLYLAGPGGRTKIGLTSYSAVVSDNGRVVVSAPVSEDMVAVNTETGAQRSLGRGVLPSVSNDGEQVLFTNDERDHLWIASTRTGERRLLLEAPVADAVLAGFGQYAVVTTRDGRLLKLDAVTGGVTELIPPSSVLSANAFAAPCDALRLYASAAPAVREVWLSGEVLPVLSRDSNGIWVQVPCTTVPSEARRPLNVVDDSPFGTEIAITIRRVAPAFVAIAHQDFSGPVDWDSPAQVGETVHLWGTGFGAVDRPVGTGEPGPTSPLSRLIDPVSCTASYQSWSPEVVWVGLAPGLVGLYQMDVRIPPQAADNPGFGLECTFADRTTAGWTISVKQQPSQN